MIVDMHAHYAMHLMDEQSTSFVRVRRAVRANPSMSARRKRRLFYMALLRWINQRFNYPSLKFGPGVTLQLMRDGGVGIVLSPLYDPINEFGSLPWWILSVLGLGLVVALSFAVSVAVALILVLKGHGASLASLHHVLVLALVVLAAAIGSILTLAIVLAYFNSQAVYGRHTDELPGSPPRALYWEDLLRQMSIVDEHLATSSVALVARDYEAV